MEHDAIPESLEHLTAVAGQVQRPVRLALRQWLTARAGGR